MQTTIQQIVARKGAANVRLYAFDDDAYLLGHGRGLKLDPDAEAQCAFLLAVYEDAGYEVYTLEHFSSVSPVAEMRTVKGADFESIFDMLMAT